MAVDNATEARQPATGVPTDPKMGTEAADAQAPQKLTFSENVILTIKILTIAGLLGAVIWGIEAWTSGR